MRRCQFRHSNVLQIRRKTKAPKFQKTKPYSSRTVITKSKKSRSNTKISCSATKSSEFGPMDEKKIPGPSSVGFEKTSIARISTPKPIFSHPYETIRTDIDMKTSSRNPHIFSNPNRSRSKTKPERICTQRACSQQPPSSRLRF